MHPANKIKILFSTLSLAVLAAAPFARAQDSAPTAAAAAPADAPPPPPRAKGVKGPMRQDPMSQVSNLTDAQKEEIGKIREDTRGKVDALPDDDNKRKAMMGLMNDARKQMRAVLNDDQKKQYDAAVKKMMRGKKKGDDAPPPPPPGS